MFDMILNLESIFSKTSCKIQMKDTGNNEKFGGILVTYHSHPTNNKTTYLLSAWLQTWDSQLLMTNYHWQERLFHRSQSVGRKAWAICACKTRMRQLLYHIYHNLQFHTVIREPGHCIWWTMCAEKWSSQFSVTSRIMFCQNLHIVVPQS